MQTYLFYDVETSGLSKCFDQILQFAAIRTDLDFQELDRVEYHIKLNPDAILSPQALLTHGLTPKALENGEQELTAIRAIHQIMNTQGTISLGYNSLRFDDEFLRFSFYRNLLPPYSHQYANRCARMDIFPMAVMYRLFKPHVVKWPERNGRPSMKLEELNQANRFAAGKAHDAMVDVKATIGLAKAFYQDRQMWDFLKEYFNKDQDLKRLTFLEKNPIVGSKVLAYGLYIDATIGERNNYCAPVLVLGSHNHYRNQYLLLRLDLPELSQVTQDNIAEKTWVYRKKLGEPGFWLPAKARYIEVLTPDRLACAKANLAWCQDNAALLDAIAQHHKEYRYPQIKNLDIDAALYANGFWSDNDLSWCRRFHLAQADKLTQWLHEVENPELYELAVRVIGRYDATLLAPQDKEQYTIYLDSLKNPKLALTHRDFQDKPRLTVWQVIDEIQTLQAQGLSNEERALLEELQQYLVMQFQV